MPIFNARRTSGVKIKPVFGLSMLLLGMLALGWTSTAVLARPATSPSTQISPLHPTFALLDQDGKNVLESGNPVSTLETCGACHDTDFIEQHSYHADAGLSGYTPTGSASSSHTWDSSSGIFGNWDALTYRYLTPRGDERIDLTTPEWIQVYGPRHVGSGPAVYSRSGGELAELKTQPGDLETHIVDPSTGELVPWDWEASGVVEMNCFLCHTPQPDNAARISALQSGQFQWANTATLLGSGIVEQQGTQYVWNQAAFQTNGELAQEFVTIQDPKNENCGLCHGLVHDSLEEPLTLSECNAENLRTYTTGQIISSEKLSQSGMNLSEKETLDRSWDVHAERLVECTDCHYALNNPVYFEAQDESQPDHLQFDPRRLEIGEYLYQPLHEFARGDSSDGIAATGLQDTMRRCESCHSIENTHNWLPYKDRHTEALDCETCHVPKLYSSAMQQQDWTVIHPDGTPAASCRGVDGTAGDVRALVTGYEPVLLPRQSADGNTRLAPYNLITSWYWVYGNPERPVRLADLQAAWLDGDQYKAEILAAFDQDSNGALDPGELVLDSPEKVKIIAGQLKALGLESARIVGEVQPYSINHNVTHGDWAVRDCQTCHTKDSRITQTFQLASYMPAEVMPKFIEGSSTSINGELYTDEAGALYYQPSTAEDGYYVLGHSKVGWIDLGGSIIFLGVLVVIGMHGTLRAVTNLRRPPHELELRREYMYSVYERFWHWLQTFTILGLLFTGLIIHKPDTFGLFSFRGVVQVHNILAVILLINAALSLFYHLASGQIKQYIPHPRGFIDQAVSQAIYYSRGIFRGDQHPFEKTPEKKLNPLQQITYFGLLNILLPLQVLTGILMWGVQRWPAISANLGGLPFLAPFHTIIAWLFAAFIIAHVYLTTTGHKPLAGIQSMIIGWDEVEVATQEPAQETEPSESDPTSASSAQEDEQE